ncbi:MarR family transcriptional regulator [Actinospica sp. MGRD01-02]|uniref:MarR family transcriptional regulator n=1 Tax=Actinospica acidithermotolerans TaxID=2828514 RepID=A0A941EKS1_9ACTN|nr:MarR family transcriptional regulator [Actinospica acidithermotolerans]MBR7830904.1 MarR family transcriptional regulator [Actinospica acidithermotolerans]
MRTPDGRPSGLSPEHTAGRAEDPDQVVAALLTASRLLVAIAAKSLTAVEETLTLPQYRLLVVLDSRGPSSLAGLAEALEVNPSTALRMVERLTTAGMVEKTANPARRREVLLRLTGAGWQTVRQVTEARRTELSRIVAAMPAEQRTQLVTALTAFTEAGGEPPERLPVLPGWH